MHIIKFNGGVGNQLFQYAFYEYCLDNGLQVSADLSIYSRKKIHGGFLLNEMLPGNTLVATKVDVEKFYKKFTPLEKIYNRAFHHVGSHYYEEYFGDFNEIIPFLKRNNDCYLDGWWQYRDMALSEIHTIQMQMGDIETYIPHAQKNLLAAMRNGESVSVHIRRGDYLDANTLYGNICTEEYYSAAFKEIIQRVSNPVFYVFSDDEDYCRKKFSNNNVVVIPATGSDKAYMDIILMSKCKHHIAANSSFSWWGIALSAEDGVIIMPSRHNNRMNCNPLAFENSLTINNAGQLVDGGTHGKQ